MIARKLMVLSTLNIVLPVFIVISIGFGLRRTGLVRSQFLFDLNRLIYFIALPSLLFYKIAAADFVASFNGNLIWGVGGATFLTFSLSYIYGSLRKLSGAVRGAFCQGAFRGNLAYIGLAIIYSAYGESGFTKAGILLGFLVPLLNILSVFALSLPNRNDSVPVGLRLWMQQIMLNPLIIASLAGIIWSYTGLRLPVVVDRSLEIVTGMSLPLALFSIGASFSFQRLKGDIGVALFATVLKVVISPIIAGVLMYHLGVRGEDLAIGLLLAGCPTATAAYIMAQQMKADAELSGAIIMLSTLLSIGTFSLILFILHGMVL